jgi:hypothetical protein
MPGLSWNKLLVSIWNQWRRGPVSSPQVEFRVIRELKRIELNVGKRTSKGKVTLNSAFACLKKASTNFVSQEVSRSLMLHQQELKDVLQVKQG